MKNANLIVLIALAALIACQRDALEPELPDYETKLSFACNDNPSEYYGRGMLRGQQLCYSTNDNLYYNFAYEGVLVRTSTDTVNYNPNQRRPMKNLNFGVGGWGYTDENLPAVPPPVFFSIETSIYETNARQFFRDSIYQGAELHIIPPVYPKGATAAFEDFDSVSEIQLTAHYSGKLGTDIAAFQTSTGPQDPNTAYLKVLEMTEKEDGSVDVTFGFRCKLYDNGRFYAEVTDGRLHTNVKF